MSTQESNHPQDHDDANRDPNRNQVTLPSFAELFGGFRISEAQSTSVPSIGNQLHTIAPSHREQIQLHEVSFNRRFVPEPRNYFKNASKDMEWMKYLSYLCDDDHQRKIFVCDHQDNKGVFCNFRGLRQTVKRHIDSVHLNRRPWVCSFEHEDKICGKKFHQRGSLMIHLYSVHTGQRPFVCSYCEEAFHDPARRNKHVGQEHPGVATRKRRKNPYAHLEGPTIQDAHVHCSCSPALCSSGVHYVTH